MLMLVLSGAVGRDVTVVLETADGSAIGLLLQIIFSCSSLRYPPLFKAWSICYDLPWIPLGADFF